MIHLIEYIIKLDDKALRLLAEDAKNRAKSGTDFQYKLNQELLANACEDELWLRGKANELSSLEDL